MLNSAHALKYQDSLAHAAMPSLIQDLNLSLAAAEAKQASPLLSF